MHHHYILIESTIPCITGNRICYGIALCDEYDNTTVILDSVTDVTSDKVTMEQFVDRCNSLQLSPLHLHDAVYDFLAQI